MPRTSSTTTKAASTAAQKNKASAPAVDLERTLPERQGGRELLDEGADGRRAADGEDAPRRLARPRRLLPTGSTAPGSAPGRRRRLRRTSAQARIRSRPGRTRASSPSPAATPDPRLLGPTRQCRGRPADGQHPPRWVAARQSDPEPERADRARLAAFRRLHPPLSNARLTALSLPQGLLDTGPRRDRRDRRLGHESRRSHPPRSRPLHRDRAQRVRGRVEARGLLGSLDQRLSVARTGDLPADVERAMLDDLAVLLRRALRRARPGASRGAGRSRAASTFSRSSTGIFPP